MTGSTPVNRNVGAIPTTATFNPEKQQNRKHRNMTFETKLDLNQEAWFMQDNKVMVLLVGSIQANATWINNGEGSPSKPQVEYGFRTYDDGNLKGWIYLDEREIFPSKEELLASL